MREVGIVEVSSLIVETVARYELEMCGVSRYLRRRFGEMNRQKSGCGEENLLLADFWLISRETLATPPVSIDLCPFAFLHRDSDLGLFDGTISTAQT